MSDPAIKLFGKTIHLDKKANEHQQLQESCSGEIKKTLEKEHATTQTEDTCSNQSTSSGINDDPKTPTTEKETTSKNTTKKENPHSNSDEKPQKPDKILPCPRCNSMDTKFCYYNNYNVNQPRHFCKNCQRYWTAGGTMRNTPVGSGRRKNKSSSSASYYRHLIINDTSLKTNGSVLNFGSNVPLCESMNQALNFNDKSQKPDDDHSSCASNSVEKGGNFQKYPLQAPCYPQPPWPYQWSTSHYRPVSFYPTPQYWGCTVQVQPQPTPWGMPWVAPQNDQITPHSPLGKHSRDGSLLSPSSSSRNDEFTKEKDSENGVLTPKTLRINDPNEAAKSSLWSTLGISKDEKCNNSINGGNLYKAFKSKNDEKNEVVASSLVNLQANPAALSRSLNFHEAS